MKYIPLIVAGCILLYVFLYLQNNLVDITKYKIKSDKVESRITIAHLSDLHSKPFKKVLRRLRDIQPDVIMITGDYINDRGRRRGKMLLFGKELVSIAPVYYITGNHERRLEDFETLMEELKEIGFHVLLNEVSTAQIGNSRLQILGLDENQANYDDYKARRKGTFVYQEMKPYFALLDDAGAFQIVLSHFPENFEAVKENNYSQYDFELQLSGHAHGGQFILPFIGPVFSPGQGVRPKYARGSFGEHPKLIVSRGLGNAEFPFRLFNHPEINVITIEKNRQ